MFESCASRRISPSLSSLPASLASPTTIITRRREAGRSRSKPTAMDIAVVKTRAAGAGLQVSNRFLDFVVIRSERQQLVDMVVVPENRGFARRSDDRLRKHNGRFLHGWQQRGDSRAGLKHQHRRKRIPAQVERFDRLA